MARLQIVAMTAVQAGVRNQDYPTLWAVTDGDGRIVEGMDGCRELHATPQEAYRCMRSVERGEKQLLPPLSSPA